MWNISRTPLKRGTNLFTVTTKYYTHFVTSDSGSAGAAPGGSSPGGSVGSEWSGVVELRAPLSSTRANRELRALLAQSFDLDSDEIRILHWARLH
jgi:hypothetical protein